MSTTTPPALAAPMPPVPTTMAGAPGGPRIAENRWEWLDAIEMFNKTSPVALKLSAQLIAYSLSRRAMDVQEAWTPQARLAAVTGMSRRTVQRAMDELEAAGFLVLVRRASQHRAPRYALTIPALGEAGADNVRGDATAPPAPVDNPTQERHGDAPAHPRDNMVSPLEPPGTTPSRARGVATPPDQRMIKHSPLPPSTRQDGRTSPTAPQGRTRTRSTAAAGCGAALPAPPAPPPETTGPAGPPSGVRGSASPSGDDPAVDAVLHHPAARGIRADVPGLVVPLTAAGWRADDIRRLLDAIPAGAPGLVVRALRDAALSPPPASSTSRPSGHRGWCRKHDRERTATGKCSACRSEALAAPASPTLICSLRR